MQKFVYPAVLFQDKENGTYVISIDDLYIVGEGDSVEAAHLDAQNSLNRYVEGTLKYDLDFVEPTKFETIRQKYPKHLVMLIECTVDDKGKVVK